MRLPALRLSVLVLIGTALSSCGNGYMLYETRYIPEPGERISTEDYAQLPWREPDLDGNRLPATPSRDAIPRYQTKGEVQIKRGTRAFSHEDDANTGYMDADHIENRGTPIPTEAPDIKSL